MLSINSEVTTDILRGTVTRIKMSRWWSVLCGAALLLFALLAYSSVFSAGYVWDDDAYVTANVHLRSLDGLYSIWFEPGATPQYYPLVFTSFWLQYHLWGLDPLGYHLVNILLHGANAILLWLCLRKLAIPGAFLAAALFVLHPVHVESVAWITELKNVQSTFFYLLAFIVYWHGFGAAVVKQPLKRAGFFWIGAFVLFGCALLSKTVSGSLPAAIMLLIWWQRGDLTRLDVVRLAPFLVLAVVMGRQTASLEVTHVLAQGPEWAFSFVERVLIAGRAVWFYAGKLFWPEPLIFNYPRWQIDAGVWWQYLFPGALFALISTLWLLRNRIGRGCLVATLYFVGTLFPALGFVNVYPMRFSFVADHFQYLASIGIIVLFSAICSLWLQRLTATVRNIVPAVILIIAAVLTWQQGQVYASFPALLNDTLRKNPGSWFAYSNRATYNATSGNDDLAMADIEQSLKIKPDEADALHLRGLIQLKRGDFTRARTDLDRSIALRPWRVDYLRNRVLADRVSGRLDEALADVGRVVAMEPDNPDNYLLRSAILLQQEDFQAALEDVERALGLDPEKAEAWANRGLINYRQGQMRKALADFDRAISIEPNMAAIYYNRGLTLTELGDYGRAMADLQKAKLLGYAVADKDIARILAKVKGPVE